jgi:Ca2+-binding EF-hand superfamily protein
MSGISSVGSSSSTAYYSPLDTNQDGIVDASELAAATQSGVLPASASADEGSSDPSATDKFSGSLAGMLLQMQQSSTTAGAAGSSADSSSADDSSDQSSVESVFKSLDANGDGKVSASEFVAGRPKDMSEADAQTLFKTLDTENTGMLNEGQFSQGVDAINGLAGASASSAQTAADGSGNALEAFLAEMQASMTAYQNTYGQYDLSASATDSAAA